MTPFPLYIVCKVLNIKAFITDHAGKITTVVDLMRQDQLNLNKHQLWFTCLISQAFVHLYAGLHVYTFYTAKTNKTKQKP